MPDKDGLRGAAPHLLVTGATGFVGRALVTKLLVEGFSVSSLVREEGAYLPRRGG